MLVASGLTERRAVDEFRRSNHFEGTGEARERELVVPDRFRGACQTELGGGLFRGAGDLLAVALNQTTVLTEDHELIGLGDNQVTVAHREISAGLLIRFLELDGRVAP